MSEPVDRLKIGKNYLLSFRSTLRDELATVLSSDQCLMAASKTVHLDQDPHGSSALTPTCDSIMIKKLVR